jgi:transcription initiation factor TFIID subunit 1
LAPWKTSKAFLEASADKAMLQLHGEGDPSGCGMAFSFIKTSMKGGYIEALQQGTNTTSAAMSAARMAMDPKKNGGHGYNVKAQQGLYNEAIRTIWDKQKKNLSDPVEHEENDHEREQADDESHNQTPHSMATPAEVDDDASQYSINSRQGKVMRITRQLRNKYGQVDSVTEIIKDPRVWREYMKRRRAIDSEKLK